MNAWVVALLVLALMGMGGYGCRLVHGRTITPMLVIVTWWGLWLTVAAADFYGFGKVGIETVFLFLVAMTGLVVGGIWPQAATPKESSQQLQSEKQGTFLLYIALAIFAITLTITYQGYTYQGLISEGDVSTGYSMTEEDTVSVYGNIRSYIGLYYLETLAGYLVIVLAPTLWFRNDKWVLPLVGALGLFGRTLLTGGRAAAMDLMLVGAVVGFLGRWPGRRRGRLGVYYAFMLILVGGLWTLTYVTKYRMETLTLKDNLKAMVTYHSAGFLILDEEFRDEGSMLNESGMWWGLASTTGIQSVLGIGIRRIWPEFVGPGGRVEAYVGPNRVVGEGLTVNAYYTILFPIYLDGGYIAVFISGALFGFWMNRWYVKMLLSSSFVHWVLVGVCLLTGFESLLYPPIFRVQYILLLISVVALRFNWFHRFQRILGSVKGKR